MPHPLHAKARHLKVGDPRVRKKYLKTLNNLLQDQKVFDQFQDLFDSVQTTCLIPMDLLTFEQLDQKIVKVMEISEKTCRKLKTGITKWSPQYQRSCDKVTYWQLVHNQLMGQRYNARKIISQKKTETSGPTSTCRDCVSAPKKCKTRTEKMQAICS